MKLLHIADLHLGKKLHGYDLLEDQKAALLEILKIAEREKPNVCLIAGDVYQTSTPQGNAMELMSDFLYRLSELGIEVFMISGNHDSSQRISYLSQLLKRANVHVTDRFEGRLQTIMTEDEFGPVAIHLLPFIKPIEVRAQLPGCTASTYEEAVRAVIEASEIDPAIRNVLVCHQYVTGSEEGGSEERIVGGSEDITLAALEAFDFVAMGHVHKPQTFRMAGGGLASYAGSLLPYAVSEGGYDKSCSLITLGAKGEEPKLDRILYPLLRKVRGVEESFERIMEMTPTEDLVAVTLTDSRIPAENYQSALRAIFPNLLSVGLKNQEIYETGPVDVSSVGKGRSDLELFEEFYEWSKKESLPEDEREIIIRLLNQSEGGTEE